MRGEVEEEFRSKHTLCDWLKSCAGWRFMWCLLGFFSPFQKGCGLCGLATDVRHLRTPSCAAEKEPQCWGGNTSCHHSKEGTPWLNILTINCSPPPTSALERPLLVSGVRFTCYSGTFSYLFIPFHYSISFSLEHLLQCFSFIWRPWCYWPSYGRGQIPCMWRFLPHSRGKGGIYSRGSKPLTSQYDSSNSPNSVCLNPHPAPVGAVCGIRAQQPAHGRGMEWDDLQALLPTQTILGISVGILSLVRVKNAK